MLFVIPDAKNHLILVPVKEIFRSLDDPNVGGGWMFAEGGSVLDVPVKYSGPHVPMFVASQVFLCSGGKMVPDYLCSSMVSKLQKIKQSGDYSLGHGGYFPDPG